MDKFYLIKKCDRCNEPFNSRNRRVHSLEEKISETYVGCSSIQLQGL